MKDNNRIFDDYMRNRRPDVNDDRDVSRQTTVVGDLLARIAELDNELSALRTKWDELPAFLVKQDEADIFDEHNLNMLLIEYLLDIKPEKEMIREEYEKKLKYANETDREPWLTLVTGETKDEYIASLEARIVELEAESAALRENAIVWHVFDIDNPNTYPQTVNMYLALSMPDRNEYREPDTNSTYDVLWWELYSEEYRRNCGVTHWAELPDPPEEKP